MYIDGIPFHRNLINNIYLNGTRGTAVNTDRGGPKNALSTEEEFSCLIMVMPWKEAKHEQGAAPQGDGQRYLGMASVVKALMILLRMIGERRVTGKWFTTCEFPVWEENLARSGAETLVGVVVVVVAMLHMLLM